MGRNTTFGNISGIHAIKGNLVHEPLTFVQLGRERFGLHVVFFELLHCSIEGFDTRFGVARSFLRPLPDPDQLSEEFTAILFRNVILDGSLADLFRKLFVLLTKLVLILIEKISSVD